MTRLIQFANNAVSRLAANISNTATSISLTPGDGSKFPIIVSPMFSMATLVKTDGTTEVVKVTARSSDTLTVVRAAEAVGGLSIAYAFTAGDKIEARMTSAGLSNELDRLDAAALLGAANKSANYTVVSSDISTLLRTNTASGTITITLPLISTLTDDFDTIIAKVSSDANTISVASSSPDTINGALTYTLYTQFQSVWLIADRSTNTWTAVTAANSGANVVVDAYTGAGSAGPFTLSGDPVSKNNTVVVVGGTVQLKSSYTLTGTALTLGGAVTAGVLVEVWWTQPLVIGVPSDASVSTIKLADASVTTAKLADASVTTAKIPAGAVTIDKLAASAHYTGFKNRIINGDMRIDQRNAGASVTPNGSYTVDRWKFDNSQTGKATAQQNAAAVTPPTGFKNYLGLTSTSAYVLTSSDYFILGQSIEGFNASDLAWGTASAAPVTLSFWVRSSLNGTFGGALSNNSVGSSYPFIYTIGSANTWEYKTVTINGPTTGTWTTDNTAGIRLFIGLGAGSSFSGAAGAWASADYRSATGATSVVGTSGATFYITGIQLEKGSTATSFDYRDYGRELSMCQRYYWKMTGQNFTSYGTGGTASTSSGFATVMYPATMRSAPTITTSNVYADDVTTITNLITVTTAYYGQNSARLGFTFPSGGAAYRPIMIDAGPASNSYIDATSEL